MDTTSAAAATKTTKLPSIDCKYPTASTSCPIESADKLRLPTKSRAITETRNSVLFFLSMLSRPTIKPKMNRISKIVDVLICVTNAAKIATTRPTMNAHLPIKSNSMLYLFLVVNKWRKVFK